MFVLCNVYIRMKQLKKSKSTNMKCEVMLHRCTQTGAFENELNTNSVDWKWSHMNSISRINGMKSNNEYVFNT